MRRLCMFSKKALVLSIVAFFMPCYADQSREDATVAKELLYRARQNPNTQTLAHLSAKTVEPKLKDLEALATNKKIIDAALERERELNREYYIFYTAVPYMLLFQDIVREIYIRKLGETEALKNKAFHFLRFNYKDPLYDQYKNVTDFLVTELSKNGIIDDNELHIKTILVSTNLSLFGNIGFTGESTWLFFSHPQPWTSVRKDFLESALKSYGLPTTSIDELIALNEYLKDSQGNLISTLLQICIPKPMINQIGYSSWRLGIPFDPEYIQHVFKLPSMTFGVKDKLSYEELKKDVAEFKERWQKNDPETVKMVQQLIKHVKQGMFHLYPFLDQFMQNPDETKAINYRQARILITNDKLLNPASGILIYRYYKLDPKKIEIYRKKLNAILDKMIAKEINAPAIKKESDQQRILREKRLKEMAIRARMQENR